MKAKATAKVKRVKIEVSDSVVRKLKKPGEPVPPRMQDGKPLCDFPGCERKAFREVYYSKSGKKLRMGWQTFIEMQPNPGKRHRRLGRIMPDDMAWSYLCYKHFVA